MTDQLRLFSFGGGVQSTAVLVLQAMGQLPQPYDVFVFANVGDDSENPATLAYIDAHIRPFITRHHIHFETVHKTTFGKRETLLQHIHRTARSVPIPARMSNGAPGNRTCTNDFKIRVIDRWIADQGYSRATVGLGISLDEFQRVRDEKWHTVRNFQKRRYKVSRAGFNTSPVILSSVKRGLCWPTTGVTRIIATKSGPRKWPGSATFGVKPAF